MEWPTPKRVVDVSSFIHLADYYRRFIEGFSKIAHPITLLQRKNAKFVWCEKCEGIFQKLKKLLTNVPVLKIADPKKDFVVCTYACIKGLGGVLMQENFVICYESRNLKEHQKNYETHNLELANIVRAIKMWRHYLLGRRFELRTNHMSLNYVFDLPSLNVGKTRWP